MTAKNAFCALASWAPRDQSPSDLATRWLKMEARLRPLSPSLSRWFWGDEREKPLFLNDAAVMDAIAACIGRDDEGQEQPGYGYSFDTATTSAWPDGPRDFRLHVNGDTNWKHALNVVSLTTAYCVDPDPGVVSYDIFKNALLALAEGFAATHAKAFSDDPGVCGEAAGTP